MKSTAVRTFSCLLLAVLGAACASTSAAGTDVRTEELTYDAGGTTCTGYLAYDAARTGRRPGVLIVHEWWGHNEYVRRRARMLAEVGYVALALDMYGDGRTAEHPEDAQKFSAEVLANMEQGAARFRAAEQLLRENPRTDPDRIAAIGYCFGGAIVLHMARIGADLDAVASFHGNLTQTAEAEPGSIKARIFVCHGSADSLVSREQVLAFKAEMQEAEANLRFIVYSGARHGFTNPDADAKAAEYGLPLGYDAYADRQSWTELLAYLHATWR